MGLSLWDVAELHLVMCGDRDRASLDRASLDRVCRDAGFALIPAIQENQTIIAAACVCHEH